MQRFLDENPPAEVPEKYKTPDWLFEKLEKRDIHCNQCGKFLFTTDKSDGAAASEALTKGFISKMPFFYGFPGVVFFCCKDCCKAWFQENVTKEQSDAGNKDVQQLKASMEAGKPALLAGLQRIQRIGEEFKKMNPHVRSQMTNGGRYYMPVVNGRDISETWFFTKEGAMRELREYLKRMIEKQKHGNTENGED
ncbi:MAG: hypothetical protein IJK32_05310 [Bacteroidales bacterium]|nr:hypothetical protein [Bacteroidales bacterium]